MNYYIERQKGPRYGIFLSKGGGCNEESFDNRKESSNQCGQEERCHGGKYFMPLNGISAQRATGS